MMNLYGGAGMGAAGTGMGAAGMGQQGGMSPQLMQMLMAMQGGGGSMSQQSGVTPPPGPMQAAAAGTPMANFIGQQGGQMHGGGAGMPMGMPQQPPGMTQAGGAPGAAPANPVNPQMMQMLQMLKGGQTGLPSTVGSANPNLAWNPNNPVGTSTLGGGTANNGWLQNLMASIGGMGGIGGGT